MHLLNVYIEPGHEAFVVKRADTVISLAKGIIRQDPAAKIILGEDLNGQLGKVHTGRIYTCTERGNGDLQGRQPVGLDVDQGHQSKKCCSC